MKKTLMFVRNIGTTGAFYGTSTRSHSEVTKYIRNDIPQVIVEYGAAYGNLTQLILDKMNRESVLYAFEINAEFCSMLNKIRDERLIVINDSAHKIDKYIDTKIDCVISTIPFTFISNEILEEILIKSKEKLSTKGTFSQILYSLYHLRKFKKHFVINSSRLIITLPLEYVYHCQKK